MEPTGSSLISSTPFWCFSAQSPSSTFSPNSMKFTQHTSSIWKQFYSKTILNKQRKALKCISSTNLSDSNIFNESDIDVKSTANSNDIHSISFYFNNDIWQCLINFTSYKEKMTTRSFKVIVSYSLRLRS